MKEKITTSKILEAKKSNKKLSMLTAYDYPTARILDESDVDIILVGDSLGNVVLGYQNTLPVTVDEMLHHLKAVKRGVKKALLVVDMPFGSYHVNPEQGLKSALRFVKEGGAEAVKVEGNIYRETMRVMIDAGIPVMGHLGFTPQLVNLIGGYKVQGKTKKDADILAKAAKELERLGVFSIILEMVPASVSKRIRNAVKVPVIGIGAGPHCDGQVLVTHDMIGLYQGTPPKFVKQYASLGKDMKEAISTFIWEVHTGRFPGKKESF